MIDERDLGLLSVVVPLHNEEGTVRELYSRLCAALDGVPHELVLVDDASTDLTGEMLAGLAASDQHVRVIHLSRNFGHQAAISAGLEHASGDAVVMMDGDLQDPPELIPRMLEHWRSGSDVVYGVRTHRKGESRAKLATARWFYSLFARVSDLDLSPNSGDFRLLDRRALDALLRMRERNRFLRGMTVWIGFTQTAVPFERDERYAGETKYSPKRMIRFSFDAISSFSWVPLQLATFLGFLFSAGALLLIPIVIALRIAGETIPGFATVLCIVLLIGGIQLITVGIIGEYVGRIYDEVKGRPLYLVRETRNFGEASARESESGTDDLEHTV